MSKVGLSFSDVFEEIPIKITNSNLIKAFLLELEESGRVESDFERLDLSTNPMLEKNLETICDCLDDLAQEQNKFQYYQRNLQKQLTQRTAWLQKRVFNTPFIYTHTYNSVPRMHNVKHLDKTFYLKKILQIQSSNQFLNLAD